jgi:hypothetical protein
MISGRNLRFVLRFDVTTGQNGRGETHGDGTFEVAIEIGVSSAL